MAEKGNYCIPAFNVYNTETVMGVFDAAEEAKAPVIMQIYPRLFNEYVGYYLAPAILAAAKKATVQVCFHLDHGPSESEVMKALRLGATGIMLDGSTHPFEENVALTKHIVESCKAVGVGVEGELGHIGSVNDDAMDEFTSPEEAAEFVKQVDVTCLAVLVGNAHGHYKRPPKLDIERIAAIRKATGGIPLVLHGGSGHPDAVLWGSDIKSKSIAPQVAALLNTWLCADCTALETDGETLYMYRPACSGNIIAKIKCETKPPMATVRTAEEEQNKIIIGIGYGARERIAEIKKFAEKINAGIAATRKMADSDYLPYELQVGLTGKTVNPDVYIAVGISGAVHHIAGIKQSGTVIAINSDKNAPIFKYADFGITADAGDICKNNMIRNFSEPE